MIGAGTFGKVYLTTNSLAIKALKKTSDLEQDLYSLMDKWKTMHANLKNATPPHKVLGELNKTNSILRDLLNGDFTNIHTNDQVTFDELKEYVTDIAPGKEKIIKLHDARTSLFEKFGINKQIKTLFGKKVPLNSGGYLII